MAKIEKLQTAVVIGTKMDKTVVVRIDRHKRNRLYGKQTSVTRKYKVHDEKNECRLGDLVRISETRPLSREKRWRVVEIVQRGDVADLAPREIGANIIEETRAAAAVLDAERAEAAARARAVAAAEEEEARAAAPADEAPVAETVAAEDATESAAEEPEAMTDDATETAAADSADDGPEEDPA
jgi:small subunit ribosomal protein S17